MARGPAPKPKSEKVRRNVDPEIEIDSAGAADPGELPESYRVVWFSKAERFTDEVTFLDETREWWALWRSSPQASAFLPSDWAVMRRLAVLVDRFHREGSTELAAEIRRQESSFGATVADRLRLRMTLKSDGDARAPKAVGGESPEDRRKRLKVV